MRLVAVDVADDVAAAMIVDQRADRLAVDRPDDLDGDRSVRTGNRRALHAAGRQLGHGIEQRADVARSLAAHRAVAADIEAGNAAVAPLALRNLRTNEQQAHEGQRAAVKAAVGGLAELDRIEAEHLVETPLLERLRAEYRQRLDRAEDALRELHGHAAALGRDEERTVRRRAILAERDALVEAARHGAIAEDAVAGTLAEIDQRLRA